MKMFVKIMKVSFECAKMVVAEFFHLYFIDNERKITSKNSATVINLERLNLIDCFDTGILQFKKRALFLLRTFSFTFYLNEDAE